MTSPAPPRPAPSRAAARSNFHNLSRACKVLSYSAVFCAVMNAAPHIAAANPLEAERRLSEPFPYVGSEVEVRAVLAALGRRAGLTVRGDGVEGTVSVDNAGGTIRTLLDDVAADAAATWWFDGLVVRIEPVSALTTRLLLTQGLPVAEVETELASLGLRDDRFPLTASADGSIVRIAGPSSYVEQVAALIETLIAARRARTGTPTEVGLYAPRVYYGRAGGN